MNVQNHIRLRPKFSDLFQRSMEETISSMDQSGRDIPNQKPANPLKLSRMGTNRRNIPVKILDPLGSDEPVCVYCSVDAYVDLASDRRGIHVSRIGNLFAKLADQLFESLQKYAEEFAIQLQYEQDSSSAQVNVEGVYSYVEPVSGLKQKNSIEHIGLFATAKFVDGQMESTTGIGINHITACPCVQETYRNSFDLNSAPLIATLQDQSIPMLTHTQRCETRITMSGLGANLSYKTLLDSLDAVVIRSQNTLPREFELSNVYLAHATPQFLEDVLRDLMVSIHKLIRTDSPNAIVSIRSISMESIHDFDIEGEIEYTVNELNHLFGI